MAGDAEAAGGGEVKKALITGITGQDGSYLAELLLGKGYEVWGIQRPSSSINTGRIDHIYDKLRMEYCDYLRPENLKQIVEKSQPDEIYNLAAQSHVRISFDCPDLTHEINTEGLVHLFRVCRELKMDDVRIYQASSSEMFGNAISSVQNELTMFDPCSPYGWSKCKAFHYTSAARHNFVYAVNGILFNHVSERQKPTFVIPKISRAAARIKLGLQQKLKLGNLDAKRDFGHAADYVEAMWLMMQADEPDDYVIATGESHTVREILDEAFGYLGLEWQRYVEIDPRLYRPTELHSLCGDATKARQKLGWQPKHNFQQIVRKMVDADMWAGLQEPQRRFMDKIDGDGWRRALALRGRSYIVN